MDAATYEGPYGVEAMGHNARQIGMGQESAGVFGKPTLDDYVGDTTTPDYLEKHYLAWCESSAHHLQLSVNFHAHR